MLVLYAITIFLSALLIFVVQLMVAKMVLPLYGGSPAVWSTCMVFFQAGLLAGYAYAHFGSKYLGIKIHAVVHGVLLLVGFILLPIAVADWWAPPANVPPAIWLLAMLFVSVGLPFVLVSATTPLVQHWFALTGHSSAKDPYFLYVASNGGSLIGLLAYPIVFEPFFSLPQHSEIWRGGYGLLVVMLGGCSGFLQFALRFNRAPAPVEEPAEKKSTAEVSKKKQKRGKTDQHSLPWKTKLHWALLAFVPCSLMLSVTTYITTDIAAVPMLWMIPLALYLITFMLTFARRPLLPHTAMQRFLPLVVLLVSIVLLSQATEPVIVLVAIHLLGLFAIGMVCHGELARLRPESAHLTEFYLWLAIGGVLGGVFNVLVAPMLFMKVGLAEYPLAVVLACLLRQPVVFEKKDKSRIKTVLLKDVLPAAILAAVTLFFILLLEVMKPAMTGFLAAANLQSPSGPVRIGIVFGVPAVVCYTFLERPIRYGLGIGALFLAGVFFPGEYGHVEYIHRSFYGVHRITETTDGQFKKLVHGNTVHGQQGLMPGQRREPLTYYHHGSPIGGILNTWTNEPPKLPDAKSLAAALGIAGGPNGTYTTAAVLSEYEYDFLPPLNDVAVVGLGAGSLAAYARTGQKWTFYEIDPDVVYIAQDHFTFWRDAEERLRGNGSLNVKLGDARLQMRKNKNKKYDLIVVDAFTSDAIPLHLLTREALRDAFLPRLNERGVIAFHISNRYLDLQPVLATVGQSLKLVCLSKEDRAPYESDSGKSQSHWILMGRPVSVIDDLARSRRGQWFNAEGAAPRFLWTDDYSNLLNVFNWGS